MSKFEIISTVTKLVIVVFTLYLCMYLTMASGDGDGGQRWWQKSNFLQNSSMTNTILVELFLRQLCTATIINIVNIVSHCGGNHHACIHLWRNKVIFGLKFFLIKNGIFRQDDSRPRLKTSVNLGLYAESSHAWATEGGLLRGKGKMSWR